jgi:hypothetical protein
MAHQRMTRPSARTLVMVGVVGLLAAGCYAHPGAPVAERIRAANLPYIDEIDYYPDGFMRVDSPPGDSISIYFFADVTEAEVQDLYCNVVTPAAAAELGQYGLFMHKGGTWFPEKSPGEPDGTRHGLAGGEEVAAPACPG